MRSDWRPTAAPAALRERAELYRALREFFHARGVLEVETPILSEAGNTDPNIESFVTKFRGREPRWLRTSPEFALKRLLAAGVQDCYELGRVFRDGEAGRRHNPEFAMLEWYRVGWDHHRLMQEVRDLVLATVGPVESQATTYRDLYRERLGVDPFEAPVERLRSVLDIDIDPAGLRRDDWLDLLMTHRLQPQFPRHRLTFVHDYPASQCALARVRGQGADAVAERFEAYLGPQELANGYHELTDAAEQRERFERDLATRRARGAVLPALDERLLATLEHGLPDCAGVALGVERLLMAKLGAEDIAEVLAFPFARA
jgi:lysyl-tRNA synthetase class 2